MEACYKDALTAAELRQIQGLRDAAAAKGVHYKIDPDLSAGIVLMSDGAVKGFMTVDCFGGPVIESAAIAASEADWSRMAEVLTARAREQGKDILFIADSSDRLCTGLLTARGFEPAFSEHRMVFDREAYQPAPADTVTIRQAVLEDGKTIAALDRAVFGEGHSLSARDIACTLMILHDGQIVGKLRVDDTGGEAGIYGFVIDPGLRGRGLGAQALTLALEQLTARDISHIYLEVNADNAPAIHLYKKLGFRTLARFVYYGNT